jgi:hypothetical protein
MPTTYPTQQVLQTTYEGKNISAICPRGFTNNADNHCAHFVGHVLDIGVGVTCATMSSKAGKFASIRVHEVFHHCAKVGAWSDLPSSLPACLVFITRASYVNVATKTMVNVPRKHVGIYIAAAKKIWHYSNSKDKVVSQRPDEFFFHYPSPDNAMFWGQLP